MTERKTLLAEVARLYYEEELTQSEIAKRIHTSRSKISRMLKEAKEEGVVEININYPWARSLETENKLLETFELNQVRVLNSKELHYNEILKGLGVLAADYLDNILKADSILGISWGKTMYNVVKSLNPSKKLPIKVVQVIGAAATNNPVIDAPDLVRHLATAYGGNYYYLYAPLFIKDDIAHNALIKQPAIIQTMALAHRADIILTGIGALNNSTPNALWEGYLKEESLENLRYKGAVGHICAHHYNINGELADLEEHNNIIGIELADLQKIDTVIGVAGGEIKARTILGALRGKHINVLITDDLAAQKVLELNELF
ncbi:DNA-binding transcriptional regulator LsrR (DeoR family) [Orenia metallireducens]|uniref:DNA-binding transcriptional regulator LsrR, DeoR family n=1 Tax=Orenia metallireducens TaxID=1413210 RepID=A0A285FXY6_9FIRM|nr:sugar-binding transcriptional regulator [Orenia metallireducens]PRX35540.1 DNA-binding transcriptional regulator LsrR (DeoR family) [Orenia metallireducens]SNY16137.1 DNA-binding transcriptional regulator LsrR, DeoR family [Orenia metallireducens]